MFQLSYENEEEIIQAAQGYRKNDTAIVGCKIFNVFTKEFLSGIVYVYAGYITHVEYDVTKAMLPVNRIIERKGYLLPGFIDTHTHIESSLLTPEQYAKMVIPHGTTTVVEDAHEIANVMGVAGIRYMMEAAENLPMRQLMTLPSCVPSVPGLESSGANIQAEDYTELWKHPRVIGLGEVMDYKGVMDHDARIVQLLAVAQEHHGYIQGHAPMVKGENLSAYLCAGPISCHEAKTKEEALEKLRQGMWIDIRDANTQGRMKELLSAASEIQNYDHICFCSDDRRCNVTSKNGHMDGIIRKAVSYGMPIEDAILAGSYHIAQELDIPHLGAIAPGYVADMVIVDDLDHLNVTTVMFEGDTVYENKQFLVPVSISPTTKLMKQKNTILLKHCEEKDFMLPAKGPYVKLNILSFESEISSITEVKTALCPVVKGSVQKADHQMFAAVCNRYGKETTTVCLMERFGIKKGAVASSIGHDAHNVTVVYDHAENACIAVRKIQEMQGGFCVVDEGKILAAMPLAIAGLMSDEPIETVIEQFEKIAQGFRKLGNHYLENPVSRITILSLLVCPYVKMSDYGLVRTEEKEIIPIILEEGVEYERKH